MNPQRLDLTYQIAWKGRWHIGSGYQSATADRLQRRWGGRNGMPFVPGSQIKGVLRHQCERLALALKLNVVDPHAESNDWRLVRHFRPLAESDLLIDRLFGSRYQGECLFVSNAVPRDSQRSPGTTAVTTRTAIDRVTGTVMEQHLFATESAEPDISLQGDIRARHPSGVLTQEDGGFPYEYALLVAGMLSLAALGGDKSVGLGRCEVGLEPNSLRWNGKNISLSGALECLNDPEWGVMVDMLREEQVS